MKALKVFENINFERGIDPISSMGIGIQNFLKNFNKIYFGESDSEKRKEIQNIFNEAIANSNFEEIPLDKDKLPFTWVLTLNKYIRFFKLDYDLYLCYRNGDGCITTNNGNLIAETRNTDAGREGLRKLIERVKKEKPKKFPKPLKRKL